MTLFKVITAALILSSFTSVARSYRDKDSIAMAKITGLPEVNKLASDDVSANRHGAFVYAGNISCVFRQKPGRHFKYYWIQVVERTQEINKATGFPYKVLQSFYINPRNWNVKYYDEDKNDLLSLNEWRKMSNN